MRNGPRAVVAAVPAAPPLLTLVAAAATPADDTDGRWTMGFGWEPESCGAHGTADPCSGDAMGSGDQLNERSFVPYVVWAADRCSTFGFAARDWQARARRQLLAATPWEVERELWTGALAQAHNAAEPDPDKHWPNDWLAKADTPVLNGGAAMDPADALGCLEGVLAGGYGGRGMIHATPKTATAWAAANLLRREGNLLLTVARDTIVVPGVGYDGSGPDGAVPAGGHFAYATDTVSVRLSEPQTFDAGQPGLPNVAMRSNRAEYRAERHAAATFDGCRKAGVLVTLASC